MGPRQALAALPVSQGEVRWDELALAAYPHIGDSELRPLGIPTARGLAPSLHLNLGDGYLRQGQVGDARAQLSGILGRLARRRIRGPHPQRAAPPPVKARGVGPHHEPRVRRGRDRAVFDSLETQDLGALDRRRSLCLKRKSARVVHVPLQRDVIVELDDLDLGRIVSGSPLNPLARNQATMMFCEQGQDLGFIAVEGFRHLGAGPDQDT